MYEVCRICLDNNVYKDIYENTLKSKVKDCLKENLVELLKFCCGLEADNQISTKLCQKCYYKLRNFYKFKSLALQNDKFLRSIKIESSSDNEDEIYSEGENSSINIKEEPDVTYQDNNDISVGNNVELPNAFQGDVNNSVGYIEDSDEDDVHLNLNDRTGNTADTDEHEEIKKIGSVVSYSANYIDDTDKLIEDNVKHEEDIVFVVESQKKITDDNDTPLANFIEDKELVESAPGRQRKQNKEKGICGPQVCPECGKIVKNLNTHMKNVHIPEESNLKYQCEVCTKVFSSKVLRNRHMSRTHGTPKVQCNICHKVVREIKRHIQLMHNREELKFQCVLCDAKFLNGTKLNIHIRTHTKDKPYECDVCQNTFATKGQMMRHKSAVHEQRKPHACHICSKVFSRTHHLREHLSRRHPNDYIADTDKLNEDFVKHEEEIVSSVEIQETYISDDNDTPLVNYRGEKEVVKSETGIKRIQYKDIGICRPHVCPDCGKIVKNIDLHMKNVHTPEDSKLKYQCQGCTKVFSSKVLRNRHMNRTHGTPKVQCNICHKVVREIKRHILLMHNKEKLKFQCLLCDAKFLNGTKLNIHIRTHTKDKPYECDVCQNTFATKGQMMRHKSDVHEQRKPYACHICQKLFTRGYHVREHLKSHSNEKLFWCDLCGKSFKNRRTIELHLLTVHSEARRIPCTVCHKTFHHKRQLGSHMISHRNDRRHLCRYCGRGFKRSDHRLNHERTHTNINKRAKKTD